MCTSISSEFILASIFSHGRDIVTYEELSVFGREIYDSLPNGGIYIDISDQAIFKAVEGSPDVFCWGDKGKAISKVSEYSGNFLKKEFIFEHLGRSLDGELKESIYNLLSIS